MWETLEVSLARFHLHVGGEKAEGRPGNSLLASSTPPAPSIPALDAERIAIVFLHLFMLLHRLIWNLHPFPPTPPRPRRDFYKELPTHHHTSANFTETGVYKYLTGEAHGGKPNDSPAVDPGKVVWVTSSSSATLSENVHGCYPHIGSSLCLWGPETDLDCGPAGSNSNSVCH